MSQVGLIAPLEPPCDEYASVLGDLGISMRTVVTDAADSHRLSDVRDAGDLDRLVPAARELGAAGVDYVVWACTSGSFAGGLAAAREQQAAIADAAQAPATSTSLALLDALQALGADVVDVVSPYPLDVTDTLVAFLADAGVRVLSTVDAATPGPSVSKRLTAADLVAGLGEDRLARLSIVPDTAVSGCAVAAELPEHTRRRTLFANQWTIWRIVEQYGGTAPHPSLGPLSGLPMTP